MSSVRHHAGALTVLLGLLSRRSVFLHHSSYAVVVFERTNEVTGAKNTQLHLAASPILALINKPNFSALLGFAQGNLTEVSSFSRGKKTEQPMPQRFKFNPEFKFGPPAGDTPTFVMTADIPEIAVRARCSAQCLICACCVQTFAWPGKFASLALLPVEL